MLLVALVGVYTSGLLAYGSLPMPVKRMSWRLEDSTACGLSGCNTFSQNMFELLREREMRNLASSLLLLVKILFPFLFTSTPRPDAT